MMRLTIVHGPPACGKTTNRDAIAAALRCDRIFDDEHPHRLFQQLRSEEIARERKAPNAPQMPHHVLALCMTSSLPEWQKAHRHFYDTIVVSYNEAMEKVEARGTTDVA